ncbi:GDP-Man:Man3GlcNAc2-PP-dolichol alpha-1,2-mannosyltransferase [Spizellomyces sp. 'palustris']|nr:GDP-Man:Man3GlcNAc2-PP-dolichol alpha-1,2-mannosyltransferase [Spizellomyces sp. 'palustris']
MTLVALTACLFGLLGAIILVLVLWSHDIQSRRRTQRRHLEGGPILGFFHPFCDAGGGGERVLWVAIKAIQDTWPDAICVIYCWDNAGPVVQVLQKAKVQFNVDIDPSTVRFQTLKRWRLLEAKRIFTLLGQSLGSLMVGWEAMQLLLPDVFIDTVGFAFVYPLAKYVFGCKVVAYTHYPTISADMLGKVVSGVTDFNNSSMVARSSVLTRGKVWYYRLFAWLYGNVGRTADVVMVNSTWTLGHINSIWKIPGRTAVVYPPCNTESLQSFSVENREPWIISVAQFRPEKAHKLQLSAFQTLLERKPKYRQEGSKIRLILIGGSRNAEDRQRVEDLKQYAQDCGIYEQLEVIENAKYSTLLEYLKKGSIGLHSMRDEHFGIGIVEYMAAGLIPVAHNSGGPKLDIVTMHEGGKTGFLAETVNEFADALEEALRLPSEEQLRMRINARQHVVDRFSEQSFSSRFVGALRNVISR